MHMLHRQPGTLEGFPDPPAATPLGKAPLRPRVSRRLRLIVMLSTLGAAAFGASSFAHAAKKPANQASKRGHAKAPAQTDDCKADKDCVMVPDDCCPCEQGGKQRAIPKKQKDAYEKERKKRCADTACTDMMSTDPSCSAKPFCGAGICELGDTTPAPAPAP